MVEGPAPQLAGRLGESVEVGLDRQPQIPGRREGTAGDQGQGEVGLGELFLGVLEEAAVADVLVADQGGIRLGQAGAGAGNELLGPVELTSVDGPDGIGTRANGGAGRGEGDLAGGVLGVEDGAGVVGDRRELGPTTFGRGFAQSETA